MIAAAVCVCLTAEARFFHLLRAWKFVDKQEIATDYLAQTIPSAPAQTHVLW